MNLYEIMGVPRTATMDEIKKAYRNLAFKFHPDRNPGDKNAEDSFKKIAEAYDVLSDPNNRARYDGTSQGHAKTYKPKEKKGKRPYSGDGFIYSDAPPTKVDIWGNPIDPESVWVDVYSNNYENGGQPDIRNI